jgi:hypothetical protein
MPRSESLARARWRCLPLTRTRHKPLTCGFAAMWFSPARCVPPRPSAKHPWSLRDRLDERDITDLINAYREGSTAPFLAAAHHLSLTSVKRPPAHRRYPPDLPLAGLRRQRRPRRIRSLLMPGVHRTHSGMRVRFDKVTAMLLSGSCASRVCCLVQRVGCTAAPSERS